MIKFFVCFEVHNKRHSIRPTIGLERGYVTVLQHGLLCGLRHHTVTRGIPSRQVLCYKVSIVHKTPEQDKWQKILRSTYTCIMIYLYYTTPVNNYYINLYKKVQRFDCWT